MDWRKAVNTLIISFILLNVFLVFNLWDKNRPESGFKLSQQQQHDITEMLKQKGITVETEIPEDGEPQAFLEIGYDKIDKQSVVEAFLGKGIRVQEYGIDGGNNYINGDKQLIVMDNGIISFFDKSNKARDLNLNEDEARILAEEFMIKHTGIPQNAILYGIAYEQKGEGYLVEYIQTHDGFLIANSYMDILVTPSGVKSFYQCWLNPYGYKGRKKTVIPPLTAIMRVADESTSPLTITRIQQGYYSKLYDAEKWQAAPVWIIHTKDESKYYVNAYTGELEQ
ncbi:MAG: hypothetical protein GX759_05425 [Thermoanaerobacterales bacterium]|nr:hypothetical protein [Thermoanaerobacterales bacterium]